MQRIAIGIIGLLVNPLLASNIDTNRTGAGLLGFSGQRAEAQQALEEKFDAQLNAADLRAWMERMADEPNHIGSPHDKANAEFMLSLFRKWGWDAEIETFEVLFPTPEKQLLEMVSPKQFTAKIHEPVVPGDRTSDKTKNALPPYHAYGADGDVTGELVYVNQGMPADYKELESRGISVKGRIVIARYGGGWRGLKPKLAYEHGAIGCLIYSDPIEDGYGMGDAYPKGGWRPADGVQRGSVADMPIYAGDPLTPGVGATKDARRLPLDRAKTILRIPVMPISYGDAQPLLAELGGHVVPESWRGALPITYHMGPGPTKVHLVSKSEWSLKPIYNVIAKIKGAQYPDQWVIRGNHHDGWVFGAWDPLSANVALMAEAKAIGALVKDGWKPKRTLVYASWDGEEAGLLGSTEWVETHAEELRKKAVLYVNSDTNARGFLRAGGSHSFQSLVNEVAGGIRDPQTGVSVLERVRAKIIVGGNPKGSEDDDKRAAKLIGGSRIVPLRALGSGSDYTPFLQHAGIASLDIRYGGEDDNEGVYHSIYDSFDHYVRFGDPDFAYGVTLASTIGRVMMRVADAEVVPVRFGDLADTVGQYVEEVHKLAEGLRESTERKNKMVDENLFKLAADPTETYNPPKRDATVPFINFAPLDNALLHLKKSAKDCDAALASVGKSDHRLTDKQLERLNELILGAEQRLTSSAGLPGRDWYRHMIYAPGLYTGYGAKTLPAIREALELRRWPEAERYVTVVANVIDDYTRYLDGITALVK